MDVLIADALIDNIDRRPSMQEIVERLLALDAQAASLLEHSAHGSGPWSTQDATSG